MVTVRLASALGLLVVLVRLDVSPVVIGMTAAVVPATIAVAVAVSRTGGFAPLLSYLEAAAMVVAVLVEPTLVWVALVILAPYLCFVATFFGRRRSAEVAALCGALLLAALIFRDVEHDDVVVIAYVMAAVTAVALVGAATDANDRLNATMADLLNSFDLVIWETSGLSSDPGLLVGPIERMLGYPISDHAQSGFWRSILHPDDAAVDEMSTRETVAGRDHELRYRALAADGSYRQIEEHVRVRRNGAGVVVGARGLFRDVTETLAGRSAAVRFAEFVASIPLGVLLVGVDNEHGPDALHVHGANDAFAELTGGLPINGLPLRTALAHLLDDAAAADLARRIATAMRAEDDRGPQLVSLRGADGIHRRYAVGVVRFAGGDGAVTFDDITERARAEQVLIERATRDPLTGLVNRAAFTAALDGAFAAAAANAHAAPITVLLADLDQFKEVNDTFGHASGDELLKEIATRLKATAPAGSVTGRLGGDEFAMLLPIGSTTANGVAVAKSFRRALVAPVEISPALTLHGEASVGIATWPDHAADAKELLMRADVAMYVAKRSANDWSVYSPSADRSSARRLMLLSDLRRGLDDGDLIVHYQPIVDRTGAIVAAEALVRWQHPRLGLVMPLEILELIDLTAHGRPLTIAVLDHAVRRAIEWRDAGMRRGVSVNLTARDLDDEVVLHHLATLLTEADLPRGTVTVEIAERLLGSNTAALTASFERLRRLGVRLSIDDFGGGGSSLAILDRLAVDEIKLDPRFLDSLRLGHDELLRSVLALAGSLGILVVAEGLDDPDLVDALRTLGCDRLQGYAISMPSEARELRAGPA